MKVEYILKLCGWYPNKVDEFTGDFVQRHAQSIALFRKVICIHIIKSPSISTIEIEQKTTKQVIEYIGYYPQKKFFDKVHSQILYAKTFWQIFNKIVQEHGLPKFVHLNIVLHIGRFAYLLKKKYNIPYVITENWTGYYTKDKNYLRKNILKFLFFKKIFKNATAFLPVSQNLFNQCQQLFNLKFKGQVIENAVDTSLFFPEEKNNDIIKLLHISSMGYQKNTDNLLHVFEKFLASQNNIHLYLIGPKNEHLASQISASKLLKANCTIVGNVSYEKVADYVRGADALVLFSRYENLPCVILECLCAGLPIISTNVGGVAEVVNPKNGFIIDNENQTQLLDALNSLILNLSTFDKKIISSNANEKFNFYSIGKKFDDAYKKLGW
ncbi:MAG: glycosyltransferase family 4 protein [Chitinophagaceae bacterium]|nr:glycosyltransferase family 4 protein [Chitinophagaceae bacterium]